MSIYDIPVTTFDGTSQTLEQYRGKVLLIVNVASKCSFTPQYAGLEELYRKYAERNVVLSAGSETTLPPIMPRAGQ